MSLSFAVGDFVHVKWPHVGVYFAKVTEVSSSNIVVEGTYETDEDDRNIKAGDIWTSVIEKSKYHLVTKLSPFSVGDFVNVKWPHVGVYFAKVAEVSSSNMVVEGTYETDEDDRNIKAGDIWNSVIEKSKYHLVTKAKHTPVATSNRLPLPERVAIAGRVTALNAHSASAVTFHSVRLLLLIGVVPILWACSPLFHRPFINWLVTLDAFGSIISFAVFGEITGFFGTMDGPLGNGHGFFVPVGFRTTTGTLKQPLFLERIFGRVRNEIDVALFLTLCSLLLIAALGRSDIATIASLIAAIWGLLCVSDRSAFTGAMGAYYYPLIVSIGFGRQGIISALRLVQSAHIFIPGIAKFGPWFVHVTPTMFAACPFVPRRMRGFLFRDAGEGDLAPSAFFARALAVAGCLGEITIPLLWLFEPTRQLGALLGACMHIYIILMVPVGAVLEWNAFNAYAAIFLYGISYPEGGSIPPLLLCFLLAMEFAGPIIGLIFVDIFSNHFSLRKYT